MAAGHPPATDRIPPETIPMRRTLAALVLSAVVFVVVGCALTSDETGTIYGYVRVAGTSTPLSGAIVSVSGEWTTSESDGFYELEGVPTGERMVRAELAGFFDYTEIVDIEGLTQHDIGMSVFVGTGDVSGVVSHATLGAIEGAVVSLYGRLDTTDAQGAYSFSGIPQLEWDVVVTAEGYRTFSGPLHVNDDEVVYDVALKKLESAEFIASADTYVSLTQSNINHGSLGNLNLFNNGVIHWKLYIYFPVDVEPTADAISATVHLYNTASGGATAEERTILVGRITEFWGENSVTWDDSLATSGAAIAEASYDSLWYEIDITDYVDDWISGLYSNQGVEIDTSEDPTASQFIFASREYAEEDKRPMLVLDYAW
ncbi:MAG: DNRLRE domain-containing protein [Candidatus Eisenbacteria bacterium]|nr:DNRLRE domain-containing protein [Candidatus Eisenbacteria bacterium]